MTEREQVVLRTGRYVDLDIWERVRALRDADGRCALVERQQTQREVSERRTAKWGMRRFPIQRGGTVDWTAAEQAYLTYAKHYGRSQSLERLAERGGFGIGEFALLYLGRDPGPRPATHEQVLTVALELGDRWTP